MNLLIKKIKENYITYLFFLFLVLFWQFSELIKFSWINFYLIPKPSEIINVYAKEILFDKFFYYNLLISFVRVFIGFLFAAISGVCIAIFISQSKVGKKIFLPLVDLIRPIPNIIWLPIVIILFPSFKISMLAIPFISALPPIVLSAYSGMVSVKENILCKIKIFKIKKYIYIKKVLLPWSFPYIRNGLNIGISNAWLGVVLSEMTAGRNGLGYYTWISFQSNNYENMMIGAIFISILGFLSSSIFLRLTKNLYYGRT